MKTIKIDPDYNFRLMNAPPGFSFIKDTEGKKFDVIFKHGDLWITVKHGLTDLQAKNLLTFLTVIQSLIDAYPKKRLPKINKPSPKV